MEPQPPGSPPPTPRPMAIEEVTEIGQDDGVGVGVSISFSQIPTADQRPLSRARGRPPSQRSPYLASPFPAASSPVRHSTRAQDHHKPIGPIGFFGESHTGAARHQAERGQYISMTDIRHQARTHMERLSQDRSTDHTPPSNRTSRLKSNLAAAKQLAEKLATEAALLEQDAVMHHRIQRRQDAYKDDLSVAKAGAASTLPDRQIATQLYDLFEQGTALNYIIYTVIHSKNPPCEDPDQLPLDQLFDGCTLNEKAYQQLLECGADKSLQIIRDHDESNFARYAALLPQAQIEEQFPNTPGSAYNGFHGMACFDWDDTLFKTGTRQPSFAQTLEKKQRLATLFSALVKANILIVIVTARTLIFGQINDPCELSEFPQVKCIYTSQSCAKTLVIKTIQRRTGLNNIRYVDDNQTEIALHRKKDECILVPDEQAGKIGWIREQMKDWIAATAKQAPVKMAEDASETGTRPGLSSP